MIFLGDELIDLKLRKMKGSPGIIKKMVSKKTKFIGILDFYTFEPKILLMMARQKIFLLHQRGVKKEIRRKIITSFRLDHLNPEEGGKIVQNVGS